MCKFPVSRTNNNSYSFQLLKKLAKVSTVRTKLNDVTQDLSTCKFFLSRFCAICYI